MQAHGPIDFFSLKKLQPCCQKTGLKKYQFLESFLFKATSIVHSNIQKKYQHAQQPVRVNKQYRGQNVGGWGGMQVSPAGSKMRTKRVRQT